MSQGVRKISCIPAAGLRGPMSLLLACLFTLMHTSVFPCVCQHSWWQMASRLKGFCVSASHDCLQYCKPWLWKGIYSFFKADELIWDHRALGRSLITSLCFAWSHLIAVQVKLVLTAWVVLSFSQVTELLKCAYISKFLCTAGLLLIKSCVIFWRLSH